MTKAERTVLYEKLYFSELERREKVSARLGLPFAVIVATIGLLSYLLNVPDKSTSWFWSEVFWSLYALSSVALIAGAWFFRKAWFGHTDQLLPTAGHIEEYYRDLCDTYSEYENSEELVTTYFDAFLFNYFVECSSANAIINDRRSYNLYRATASLTISVLLAFLSLVSLLVGNGLDLGDSHDKTGSAAATTTTSAKKCKREYAEAPIATTTTSSDQPER